MKCMAGLYDLDIDRYIERPLHQSTRSSFGDFLRPNLCKTALYRNLFFNRIIYLWNQLPNDIKLSTTVSILKSKLFSYYSDKLNTVFDIDRPRIGKHYAASVVHCQQIVVHKCSELACLMQVD